jgi:hypothetical protein
MDAKIAQVVRLMVEKDRDVVLGGAGARVAEKPIEHMHRVLEQMWRQRRQAGSNFRRSKSARRTGLAEIHPPELVSG